MVSRAGFTLGWIWVATIAAGWCAADVCRAQQPDDRPGASRPSVPGGRRPLDAKHAPDGAADRPQRGGHRGGGPLGPIGLIRPTARDFGPLAPGEGEELLTFARDNVPMIHRFLVRLQARDPARFDEALTEAAPRLRQLQRLFRERPQIAARFVEHVNNMEAIRRGARLFAESGDNPVARQRAEADVRRRVAENLMIERDLLLDHANELEERLGAAAAEEFVRLTSPDADLAPEPPPVRDAVRRILEESDDIVRAEEADALRRMIERRLQGEIDRVRNRALELRARREQEVDVRTERILTEAMRRPADDRGERGPGMRGRDAGSHREDGASRPGRDRRRSRPFERDEP